MKRILIGLGVAGVLAVLFVWFINMQKKSMPLQTQVSVEQESTSSAQSTLTYQGKILAGNSSPFLEFKKEDYQKALADNKIILLDFYATWCPICRAEEPIIKEGFNLLDSDKIVGFRVNFNDPDTDEDEKQLAKDFKVPYQHTKIFLKNGKEFSRSVTSWTLPEFKDEAYKALSN